MALKGIAEQPDVDHISMTVNVDIQGVDYEAGHRIKGVRTLQKLNAPVQKVVAADISKWPHLQKVTIADRRGPSEILIGKEHHHLITLREIVWGPTGASTATLRVLG